MLHFPVGGWLRVATAFAKRVCDDGPWDEPLIELALEVTKKVAECLKEGYPVRGIWNANLSGTFKVWCDASRTPTASVLECNGKILED